MKVKKRLFDFRDYWSDFSFSSSSAKTYFCKVKTFYMHFEIEIQYLSGVQYCADNERKWFEKINLSDNLLDKYKTNRCGYRDYMRKYEKYQNNSKNFLRKRH